MTDAIHCRDLDQALATSLIQLLKDHSEGITLRRTLAALTDAGYTDADIRDMLKRFVALGMIDICVALDSGLSPMFTPTPETTVAHFNDAGGSRRP